ncbi:MAG: DNA-binding response regulator [Flavobacteriales bacterium]|jgi:two-component system LytT family response regulator|nr:DNA-binding response regulator [Flavobacteriales bacterium]|tara:strand:+ start:3814 stop:4530 length:717 start_codon:yes stop_codon:yes gene_type:complete
MKALLVDDERLARTELTRLLEKFPEIEIIGEATNGEEAIEKIEELNPDLVFLDIQMPGMTGFEVLEHLHIVPNIIFVTAYDEYALKAFEVNALDYVLKPVELNRLEKAIEKVKEDEKESKSSNSDDKLTYDSQIFIKDGEKCWFVKMDKVRMFESEGNYVRLYFEESKPMILKSLNNLEKRLNDKEFFRISRKYIINLTWIDKVEAWFNGGLRVTLKSGEKLEISRRQTSRFKELMSI